MGPFDDLLCRAIFPNTDEFTTFSLRVCLDNLRKVAMAGYVRRGCVQLCNAKIILESKSSLREESLRIEVSFSRDLESGEFRASNKPGSSSYEDYGAKETDKFKTISNRSIEVT